MLAGRLLFVVIVALLSLSCSAANDPPVLDGAVSARLEARAIWQACSDMACAGSPIFVSASTSEAVRAELAESTDEIQYLSATELEALAPGDEMFPDRATSSAASRPQTLGESGVVGVDVSISKAPWDLLIRTYVFRWDGDAWVSTSADAVGVTVTSTVS